MLKPSTDLLNSGSSPRAGRVNFLGMQNSWRVLLAVALFAAFASSAEAQSAKWEYLVVSAALKNRNLERLMNERGAEGWELVAFTRKDVAIFKRKAR